MTNAPAQLKGPSYGPAHVRRPVRTAAGRPPTVAGRAMVATSQPLATWAGLRALNRGGNAADAALAAAAMQTVVEPMSTGIGGDCFAIVWKDGKADALDAAGPAPARIDDDTPATRGPRSVTVPGAVAGWAELNARYGRLSLEECLADAIDAAERGFAVAAITAQLWAAADSPAGMPAPALGERVTATELAATLRRIAEGGPDAFYRGPVAEAIASVSWLGEEDLRAYAPRWVEPLRHTYRGTEVLELPAPTQGVAALEALGLLERMDGPTLPNRIRAARLAIEDALANVRDGVDVSHLLDPAHLDQRVQVQEQLVAEPLGGTVYIAAVDEDRMAVSFIQSLYMSFGSGVVAPGTGVVLQNRGAGFGVQGRVVAGTRPYHTIIPGMMARDGDLYGPFGIMGGPIQAQAHMQFVSSLVDDGLDVQAALDRPRFLVAGDGVHLEEGYWPEAAALEEAGEQVVLDDNAHGFGGGQAVVVQGEALVGGSDPRKDGHAGGF
ncbi:gamma-glutamyltransferase family protein [Georgenia yuyongxinii]|uniref:Gamma-glutamyltransferase n=1 Tax=Georgenia yuyongxinii TaxID=2589797 RepID=A0A552WY11_9MICO|nr:gamma-glutamyltransferase [Georgenia yuyongxinii]TRW47566.1 gamma-glutamyltransferase [Georgenia yuyongxinii]